MARNKRVKKPKDPVRERKVIGIGLAATAGLSFLFLLITDLRSNKIRMPRVLSGKNFEITMPEASFSKEDLGLKMDPILEEEEGRWSIWVEELEGDFSWSYDENKKFAAASLIKLPIVVSLYKKIQKGELDYQDTVTVKKEDLREGAGILSSRQGEELSLKRLGFLALNSSDNTAAAVIVRILGEDFIRETVKEIGMEDTSLKSRVTTSYDTALFFRSLYRERLLDEPYRSDFIDALTDTAFEERVPQGVPEGIKVAHKVGSLETVVSDAGIIFVPENPILIVFLSEDVNFGRAENFIRKITQEIYWFLMSFQA